MYREAEMVAVETVVAVRAEQVGGLHGEKLRGGTIRRLQWRGMKDSMSGTTFPEETKPIDGTTRLRAGAGRKGERRVVSIGTAKTLRKTQISIGRRHPPHRFRNRNGDK